MGRMKNVFVLLLLLIVTAVLCLLSYVGWGDNVRLGVKNINLGLDLAGGVSVVYQAEEGSDPTTDEMNGALAVIQRRLDAKGYTEASAYIDGTDRIRVDIPGVEDANEAVSEIGKTALLTFVGVDWNTLVANSDFMAPYYQQYADDYYNTLSEEEKEDYDEESLLAEAQTFMTSYPNYAVQLYPQILTAAVEQGLGEVVLSGTDVEKASYQYGQYDNAGNAGPYVSLKLKSEGADKFAKATETYLNKFIAIRLDEVVCSMPTVSSIITTGEAVISGSYTEEEAKALADDINGGALPVQLKVIQMNSVGATLGQDSLQTSIMAAVIGFVLILIFMCIYYKIPGIASALALCLYVALVLLAINLFDLTLTLAGVAGIILSIGMAVDANVIIFSRITEELKLGRGLRVSIYTGFHKALSAIVDGNVTTLLVALVLYALGSGTIRGFAQTLALGIVLSMFTALVVTRLYLNQFVAIGTQNPKAYESMDMLGRFRKSEKQEA